MSTADLYLPEPYTRHPPSAPTTDASPTFEYDAEATQVLGHASSVRRLKKAPSLSKKDTGTFHLHLEKEPTERKSVVRGETTRKLRSNRHSLIAVENSTGVPHETLRKPKQSAPSPLKICFIVFVLGIFWVPGVLSLIQFPKTMVLGVSMLSWSIWLTILWAGFWIACAISYFTSSICKSTSVVSLYRSQHTDEVRASHKSLGLHFWTVGVWLSYQVIVVRTVSIHASAEEVTILGMIGSLLLGIVLCLLFFALEKRSIRRISENFHERSYAKRIQDMERVVQALCILYKNSVDVVLRSDARDSELMLGWNPSSGRHNHMPYGAQLKGGVVSGYLQAFVPSVRIALSTPVKSRLLARRIFYSFSRPGTNVVRAEDVAAFFLTPDDAGVAFGYFDRDENGNVSRDVIEATCLEFHQEQVAIEDSIRDMDAALLQLDGIMMSVAYVACAVVVTVITNAQLAFLIAGVGALILGLSWVAGGSLHEVLTSIIFLFSKHPFDVGDMVIINNEGFTVKEIKLLSTVFLDTNSTLLQVSNHRLNNLFIYNSRRSPNLSETFMFDVHYSTTFQEMEQIREKMLEFVKSESSDFLPVFDVTVKDFPGQTRIILSADIKYKSNIGGLKVMRRNKWLCALKSTLAELHIYGPTGEPNVPLSVQRSMKVASEILEQNDPDRDQGQTLAQAL